MLDREGGVRTFRHPEDGDLCFLQHTLTPAERADYKLVVLQPVSSARAVPVILDSPPAADILPL